MIDNRTAEKKMSDILRIWSQVLTREETQVWNKIRERDLSKDISLKSGLRTPKSIIDQEIKQFRQISAGKKCDMLKTLQQLPEDLLSPANDQSQLSDPSDIPETTPNPLLFEESSLISYLDQ